MGITKAIILAAGKGARLLPATRAFGKPLLPIFDKPMIYYPLATLIRAGIRDIAIVTAPRDTALFRDILGDGAALGVSIRYIEQAEAKGIAHAYILARDFIAGEKSCLILGDNFFYGENFRQVFKTALDRHAAGAAIFTTEVEDPSSFGVVRFDDNGRAADIVEKPDHYISSHAVTGLYLYDEKACDLAATLSPSPRGELEIMDLNKIYFAADALDVVRLDASTTWFDLGTHDAMLSGALFVQKHEALTQSKIGCPYTAAFEAGFITRAEKDAALAPAHAG